VFIGVYPKPVLDIINPAVQVTMAQVGTTDPVPPHPAPGVATTTAAYTTALQKGLAP
jgi:NADH-quinone oxidoreductase subunit M